MALAFAFEREGPSPIPTVHRQRPGSASFQAVVVFKRISIAQAARLTPLAPPLENEPKIPSMEDVCTVRCSF
jgi:hypothetical protein